MSDTSIVTAVALHFLYELLDNNDEFIFLDNHTSNWIFIPKTYVYNNQVKLKSYYFPVIFVYSIFSVIFDAIQFYNSIFDKDANNNENTV